MFPFGYTSSIKQVWLTYGVAETTQMKLEEAVAQYEFTHKMYETAAWITIVAAWLTMLLARSNVAHYRMVQFPGDDAPIMPAARRVEEVLLVLCVALALCICNVF